MEGVAQTRGGHRTSDIGRAIMAAVLFSLVIAVWVCLWVPSVPIP